MSAVITQRQQAVIDITTALKLGKPFLVVNELERVTPPPRPLSHIHPKRFVRRICVPTNPPDYDPASGLRITLYGHATLVTVDETLRSFSVAEGSIYLTNKELSTGLLIDEEREDLPRDILEFKRILSVDSGVQWKASSAFYAGEKVKDYFLEHGSSALYRETMRLIK